MAEPITGVLELYAREHNMVRDDLVSVLLKTVSPTDKTGKPTATLQDLIAFVLIARKLDLDPWAREIFLIMTKGGIKPYISVDGWAKMANRDPNYDGCEFAYEQGDAGQVIAVTATMYHKTRGRPIVVTEFLGECIPRGELRDDSPWRMMPSRMLRHRAFMQAARLCFGITGLDEEGEAFTGATIELTRAEAETVAAAAKTPPKAPQKQPPSPRLQEGGQQPMDTQRREPETQQAGQKTQQQADERSGFRRFDEEPKKTEAKEGPVADVETFVNELHDRLNEAKDVEQLRTIWVDMNPAAKIMPNKDMMGYVQGLYDRIEAKLKKAAEEVQA